MHASTDPRLVLCLDGLQMSFAMLGELQRELHPACIKIPANGHVSAFLRAWSFIDVVHRIRVLSEDIPGLSQKTRELTSFQNSTRHITTMRNYIQHLKGELNDKLAYPVWGSLAWISDSDPTLCHIVHAGALVGTKSDCSVLFDMHEGRWASNVSLTIEECTCTFDIIYAECLRFRDFIMPWIIAKYTPGMTFRQEIQISTFQFIFTPKQEPGGP